MQAWVLDFGCCCGFADLLVLVLCFVVWFGIEVFSGLVIISILGGFWI